MTPVSKAIGARLRELREGTGMSGATLANQMGASRQFVSYYERGLSEPTPSTLHRFATHIGVTVQAVLAPIRFDVLCAAPEVALDESKEVA